jgi:uncharacterized protein (DUF2164 family)
MKSQNSNNLLSKDSRKKAIEIIIDYFEVELDKKIGVIAAEDVLDMFLNEIGKGIYNKAVEDSKEYLKERNEQILIDLEALLKK